MPTAYTVISTLDDRSAYNAAGTQAVSGQPMSPRISVIATLVKLTTNSWVGLQAAADEYKTNNPTDPNKPALLITSVRPTYLDMDDNGDGMAILLATFQQDMSFFILPHGLSTVWAEPFRPFQRWYVVSGALGSTGTADLDFNEQPVYVDVPLGAAYIYQRATSLDPISMVGTPGHFTPATSTFVPYTGNLLYLAVDIHKDNGTNYYIHQFEWRSDWRVFYVKKDGTIGSINLETAL